MNFPCVLNQYLKELTLIASIIAFSILVPAGNTASAAASKNSYQIIYSYDKGPPAGYRFAGITPNPPIGTEISPEFIPVGTMNPIATVEIPKVGKIEVSLELFGEDLIGSFELP